MPGETMPEAAQTSRLVLKMSAGLGVWFFPPGYFFLRLLTALPAQAPKQAIVTIRTM